MKSQKDTIEAILSKQKGVFAVACKNLDTGETLLINENESFHAASTMKTPVMMELFKVAGEGGFSLNDSVLVHNQFKSIVDGSAYSLDPENDSEQSLYSCIGQKETIRNLMYLMITQSSNLATNILIEMLDAKKITASMRQIGAEHIQVLRGVEDEKAYELEMNNTTTARDQLFIYEYLASGAGGNTEAASDMIDILSRQEFNTIIPARLPAGTRVAHKTGDITGVFHDAGIIFLPDGKKYVLVLLSKKVEEPEQAKDAMAGVSEILYQSMRGNSK